MLKCQTIVGILTFISMINTTSESLKARNVFIFQHFSFYEQLKFHVNLSWARKKFYNLRACLTQFFWRAGLNSVYLIRLPLSSIYWLSVSLTNHQLFTRTHLELRIKIRSLDKLSNSHLYSWSKYFFWGIHVYL